MGARSSMRHLPGLLRRSCAPSQSVWQRPAQHARKAHSMPTLGKWNDAIVQNGVPGLYSAEGVDMAWTQYQQMMIDRLNHILAGDVRENWDVKTVLLNTARNPATANTFNYASMAHNNHFFFRCLSADQTPSALPDHLERDLAASFSSVSSLRDTMLATAQAMFGPGFVWLVQTNDTPATSPSAVANSPQRVFKLLTTYLAGSPYPEAHARQQSRDLNTHNLASAEDYSRQTRYQNSAGAFGSHAGNNGGMGSIGGGASDDVRRFGGAECVPVLCVNTWEHAYLLDWGLKGKREYLEAWWDRIDWEAVAGHCPVRETRRLSNLRPR